MNLGLISLVLLLAAIAIGFARNCNVGILCIGFSMILGVVYGISAKDILSGFSSSLFVQMVGITYLFAIINGNGTLELLARKLVGLVGKRKHLIPFVLYILGFAICAVGPGAIPSLAIIPVIAIPVAMSAGVNPIMAAIIGDLGVMSGRMSPLTPESAVVSELMKEQGMSGSTIPIMIALTITALVVSAMVYIYYKGWKVDENAGGEQEKLPAFNRQQWMSILGLVVLAVGALFFSWNVGLTGFTVGTALIVLGAGEEKKAISAIPWNVILMVLGVGILMNVISLSGGIDIMVSVLESIMSRRTASMIMAVTAGIMSFFSSGLGVVFPTLIPTASGLAAGLGVDALELVSVIVIGGTVSGFTPISTTGALIMAGVAQQENAEEKFPQNKLFMELFAVSFLALAILAILAFTGIYGLI
ncbi:MAG: SLC13 family permease [Lachnospiraceae bacterium]|nr:SLC13 family permease [Lachnospiraceae bacterium]